MGIPRAPAVSQKALGSICRFQLHLGTGASGTGVPELVRSRMGAGESCSGFTAGACCGFVYFCPVAYLIIVCSYSNLP